MNGHSEATRQRLRKSLGDRLEAEWAAHVEAKIREGAHADCVGWQFVPEEVRVICSCGEVIATEGKWGARDA